MGRLLTAYRNVKGRSAGGANHKWRSLSRILFALVLAFLPAQLIAQHAPSSGTETSCRELVKTVVQHPGYAWTSFKWDKIIWGHGKMGDTLSCVYTAKGPFGEDLWLYVLQRSRGNIEIIVAEKWGGHS